MEYCDVDDAEKNADQEENDTCTSSGHGSVRIPTRMTRLGTSRVLNTRDFSKLTKKDVLELLKFPFGKDLNSEIQELLLE